MFQCCAVGRKEESVEDLLPLSFDYVDYVLLWHSGSKTHKAADLPSLVGFCTFEAFASGQGLGSCKAHLAQLRSTRSPCTVSGILAICLDKVILGILNLCPEPCHTKVSSKPTVNPKPGFIGGQDQPHVQAVQTWQAYNDHYNHNLIDDDCGHHYDHDHDDDGRLDDDTPRPPSGLLPLNPKQHARFMAGKLTHHLLLLPGMGQLLSRGIERHQMS